MIKNININFNKIKISKIIDSYLIKNEFKKIYYNII